MESKRAEEAVACFKSDFSCSQAVFSVYAEQLGLDKQVALKISCAFGGGMARMAETCGAVTGALMVIGLKHGKARPDDNDARDRTYALAGELPCLAYLPVRQAPWWTRTSTTHGAPNKDNQV